MDLLLYSTRNQTNLTTKSNFVEKMQYAAIPQTYQPIVITVYTLTAVFAFFANVITLLVLSIGKRTSPELKKYLNSLSCSDILLSLFSAPFTYTMFMYGRWLFQPFFCPVVLSMQVLSVYVSVYTLVIVGIDRYYAIVHPLNSSNWWKNFPRITILLVWVSGIGLSSITYFNSEAIEFEFKNQTYYDCRETWDEVGMKIYTVSMFMITYAIPVSMLVFLYSRMAYAVTHRQFNDNLPEALQQQKIHVIKMMIVVVFGFVLCWTGIQLFVLIVYMFPGVLTYSSKAKYYVYVGSYFTLHWISMFHSTINPIIYSFMSKNFRVDFKQLTKGLMGYRTKLLLMKRKNSRDSQDSQRALFRNYTVEECHQ